MAEKSKKRIQLETALAESPDDLFLRYGLGVQCLRDGETEEGRSRLKAIIADSPDETAAYQQLGQSYMDQAEVDSAKHYFKLGIECARRTRNAHAESEMTGFLAMLG